jgi:hypothetical protein
MAKHLIPSCGPGYDRFFKNVVDYTGKMMNGSPPPWTLFPLLEYGNLSKSYTDWETAYSRTTKAETAAMKAAYTRTKKVLSRFIQVWFRGFPDIVTAEHLANMDIPPIENTPTPIPEPDNQVEADLTFPGIHLVELAKIRPVSGTPPDPRSDYGVRIYFGFSAPPARPTPSA